MEARPFGSGGAPGKDNLSLFHGSLPGAVYLPLPLMYGQMNSCPLVPNPLLPFPASMLSQHGFNHQVASVLSSSGSLLLNHKQQQQQSSHSGGQGSLGSDMKDSFGLLNHLQDHHRTVGSKGSPYDFALQGRPFFPSALHHFRCADSDPDVDGVQGRPISSLSRSACTLSAAGSEPSCSPSSCTDEKGMLMGDKGEDSALDDNTAAASATSKIEDLVADYSKIKRETPWNVRDHFPSRCPVCGVSISPADLAPHFRTELESLTEFHKNREWVSMMDLHSPEMSSPKAAFHDSFRFTSRLADRKPPLSRWEMFLRVRLNRQNRISAARGRTRRRSGEMVDMCQTKTEDIQDDNKQLERASAMSSSSAGEDAVHRPCGESVHGWNSAESQNRDGAEVDAQNYAARAPSASEVTTTSADDAAAEVKAPVDDDDKCAASRTPEELIELLQKRLRDLEANPGLCPICRATFEKPVVSVGCWHVHCEKCWLQVLGSSKHLCPRCGVMTSPGDLRRIHL